MTEEQKLAIKGAFADLCGALQAFHQGDIHVHDWEAHADSINELMDAFPDVGLELPDSLSDTE